MTADHSPCPWCFPTFNHRRAAPYNVYSSRVDLARSRSHGTPIFTAVFGWITASPHIWVNFCKIATRPWRVWRSETSLPLLFSSVRWTDNVAVFKFPVYFQKRNYRLCFVFPFLVNAKYFLDEKENKCVLFFFTKIQQKVH